MLWNLEPIKELEISHSYLGRALVTVALTGCTNQSNERVQFDCDFACRPLEVSALTVDLARSLLAFPVGRGIGVHGLHRREIFQRYW